MHVAHRLAQPAERLLDTLHDGLADLEIDVDRVDLHDARQLGRTGIADQRTDTDQVARRDAVERRRHLGVAEVDVGDLEVGLRAEDGGAGFGELGLGIVDARLGGELLLPQRRLAAVFDLGVGLRSLVGFERGLGLIELRLIGVLLDDEQQIALFDRGPVDIFDLFEKALHARFELDLVERLGVAGELDVKRHVLLQRLRDHDLGRRRRNIGILLAASRQNRQRDAEKSEGATGAQCARHRAQTAVPDRQRHVNHTPFPAGSFSR